MTYLRGNHAVRSNRWRYIRYADGTEELYDHSRDSDELSNLALKDGYQEVIGKLSRFLPSRDAAAAGPTSRE